MYDREKQRQRILEMLQEASKEEIKYTKNENFHRAIQFALEEVDEFEEHYNKFIQSISHLQVYQEIIKDPLDQDMKKLIRNLKYLIEKNYTQEEKAKMPPDVLHQVRRSQERRVKLLKNIARTYFYRPKKG